MPNVTIGSGILDFGNPPVLNSEAFFPVGGQAILAGSEVEAWIMGSITGDHSFDEHKIENLKIWVGNLTIASGFVVYGECILGTTTGKFLAQWAWV